MTDRKKPTAGFWITVVLVAVLVGYPLSVGPLQWLDERGMLSDSWDKPTKVFYAPLDWLVRNSEAARAALSWYVGLWVNDLDDDPAAVP
jgi:hypothetical protein